MVWYLHKHRDNFAFTFNSESEQVTRPIWRNEQQQMNISHDNKQSKNGLRTNRIYFILMESGPLDQTN
jgi:hypothetical protein